MRTYFGGSSKTWWFFLNYKYRPFQTPQAQLFFKANLESHLLRMMPRNSSSRRDSLSTLERAIDSHGDLVNPIHVDAHGLQSETGSANSDGMNTPAGSKGMTDSSSTETSAGAKSLPTGNDSKPEDGGSGQVTATENLDQIGREHARMLSFPWSLIPFFCKPWLMPIFGPTDNRMFAAVALFHFGAMLAMSQLAYPKNLNNGGDWLQSLEAAAPSTLLFVMRQCEPKISSPAFSTVVTWALDLFAWGVVPGSFMVILKFAVSMFYMMAFERKGGQAAVPPRTETVPSLDEVVEWFNNIAGGIAFALSSNGSIADISSATANRTTSGNYSATRITSPSISAGRSGLETSDCFS